MYKAVLGLAVLLSIFSSCTKRDLIQLGIGCLGIVVLIGMLPGIILYLFTCKDLIMGKAFIVVIILTAICIPFEVIRLKYSKDSPKSEREQRK